MFFRRVQLLIDARLPQELPEDALVISDTSGLPFTQTANLLGQEFSHILFDARDGIHLESLAIAAGTLRAGGTLLILLPAWQGLETLSEQDSLRWAGESEPIATPNFIRYFQSLVEHFHFPVFYDASAVEFAQVSAPSVLRSKLRATADQRQIIEQILAAETDCYFLSAKRGRGKSILAALLSTRLNAPIYLTAQNKSAVKNLLDFSAAHIRFMAPDDLIQTLHRHPDFGSEAWLFVDEAATLPLAQLQQFSHSFKHILFMTTVHGYEGTGRGFELKFSRKIDRTFTRFELTEPLRWPLNDKLEAFIDELLLLEAEDKFDLNVPTWRDIQNSIHIQTISQQNLAQSPHDFYGLLTLAHYRTSVSDLRRLFDAKHQRFYAAYLSPSSERLMGAVWGLEEGGIADEELILAISRGQRRPRGNLVPQALCVQQNNTQVCRLHSLRLSRIAVHPNWQHRGIGSRLVEFIAKKEKVDFLSVSFGYTAELARFWQKNGFRIVHLATKLEASSGCYSVIALRGISAQGNALVDAIQRAFERNIGLSFHPLADIFAAPENDWRLTREDWLSLKNFADFNRTLNATIPALRRLLLLHDNLIDFPLLRDYLVTKRVPIYKKNWLKLIRAEVQQMISQTCLLEAL